MHTKINSHLLKLIGGFSVVGLLSTLVSLALLFVCLKQLKTPLIITYIGIYVSTTILSFVLNSIFVFRSGFSFNNGFKYLFVYLSGMLLATFLLWLFKKTILFENYILGYLVLPFTMLWNFALSYKILKPIKPC